jgi:cell division protein FtsA
MENERLIVGLDIGTTKVAVVIGKVIENAEGEEEVRIVGLGSEKSTGLHKGAVVNIDATINSIRKAVEDAEQMSGLDVTEVYVGIAGSHIRSFGNKWSISITSPDKIISSEDVRRLLDQAAETANIPGERKILHTLPGDFTVDNLDGVKDPVGMAGTKLSGEAYLITAEETFIRNILMCVERAGLSAVEVVLEPLASSYAVLNDDEREIGVAVLDIGGGTSDLAIFSNKVVLHTSCIEFGGAVVTQDLSTGLRTIKETAEKIKMKYGSCRRDPAFEEEKVEVQGVAGRENKEYSRAFVAKVIRARIREIFTMLNREMEKHRLKGILGAGVVLTGGGAMVDGVAELAEEVFAMPVKVGVPGHFEQIDERRRASHSTGIGLVLYGLEQEKLENKEYEAEYYDDGEGFLAKAWSVVKGFF